jgi:hypothetical protein
VFGSDTFFLMVDKFWTVQHVSVTGTLFGRRKKGKEETDGLDNAGG